MSEVQDRLNYLVSQWASQASSKEEEEEFLALLEQSRYEKAIKGVMLRILEDDETMDRLDKERWQPLLQKVLQSDVTESGDKVYPLYPQRRSFNWTRVAAAAAVIVVVSAGVFYFTLQRTQHNQPVAIEKPVLPDDVKAPESNRAMITLANGQRVYLDSANNGQLAVQGNVQLVKLANGKIAYTGEQGVASGELVYNTLTNPRGSKVIDMMLADGSHVWLNAGSSVKYPVAFVGNERKVEITGEAYFEVAHDAAKPFIVSKGEMSVQVLGTHFNVNAYEDEQDIKVTLLEGSVKVTLRQAQGGRPSLTIAPGQQAVLSLGSARDKLAEDGKLNELSVRRGVNIEQVMAWKNGLFSFDKADIKDVMRQLARWYDVEVSYEGKEPSQLFGGEIQRTVSLSKVLQNLEHYGVHFKMEGKKIIVLP